MKSKLSRSNPFAARITTTVSILLACTGLVRADDDYWTATAGGSWNTAANWDLSEIPSTGDNAFFNGPAPSAAFTGNSTITVDTSPVLGTLNLNKLGVFTATFSGSGNQILTLNNGITTDLGASLTISQGAGLNTLPILLGGNNAWALVGTAGSVTVSSIIDDGANSFRITKTGTRSLTLSGANTFDGGITHRQATINIAGVASATVLGNGTFTFGNLEGSTGANALSLNAGVSKTFTNSFVHDNAENNDGGQVAQISTAGGSSGYRTLTFNTGTFSTGASYNANQALNLIASTGTTGLSEGAYFFNGSWAGYAAGANNSAIRIGAGSVVLNSTAIAGSGGYSINGNDAAIGAKLILATAGTTMANRVEIAGSANGMRSSFGVRHASGTSTQSGGLSVIDTDGGNVFSQTSGATLAISGIISGASPLRINDRYTFTSADTNNSQETPVGTVAITNGAVSNSISGGITVVNGTFLLNGDAGFSGTGSGTVTVGTIGAAVSPQIGAAVANTRVITGVNNGTAKTLALGQSITAAANIPANSVITGITIGAGLDAANASTVVINNTITTASADLQFTTTAFSTNATLGGTGRIAPTVPSGVLVNTGSSVSLVDGTSGDLLIRFVAAGSPQSAGTAVFSTGSTFNFELAAPGTGDRIDFTGLATANAGGSVAFNNNVVNFTGLTGVAPGTYTLFTFDAPGKYTGTLVAGTLPAGISGANFDYVSDPLAITVTLTGGSPYITWANGYLPADVSNPAGDNDNDGLVNQQEFAFGLNPISGSSVNPILVQLNQNSGTFTYQRRAGTGLAYTVLKSTTLAAGSWTPAGAGEMAGAVDGNGNESVVVTLPGAPLGDAKLFVRVAAQ